MTQWAYLAVLVLGLGCMVLMDRRWGLVLWADARRAAVVLTVGVALFLSWDVAALRLRLYRGGESTAMTGVQVAPDLPVEEIFFILFLCYLTLVLHRLAHRVLVSRGATGGGRS